jgi:hypothetical protein
MANQLKAFEMWNLYQYVGQWAVSCVMDSFVDFTSAIDQWAFKFSNLSKNLVVTLRMRTKSWNGSKLSKKKILQERNRRALYPHLNKQLTY